MARHKKGSRGGDKSFKKSHQFKNDIDEDNEDELDLYNDENEDFFDEEFVPPEGEDLDEFDEATEDVDMRELDEVGDEDIDGEDFGEEGEGEDDEMMGEEENDGDDDFGQVEKIVIDNAKLSVVIKQANQNSKGALKLFLKIFKGIIMQGLSDELDEGKKKKRKNIVEYEVESGKVYNKIIRFALTRVPHLLKYQIENVSF